MQLFNSLPPDQQQAILQRWAGQVARLNRRGATAAGSERWSWGLGGLAVGIGRSGGWAVCSAAAWSSTARSRCCCSNAAAAAATPAARITRNRISLGRPCSSPATRCWSRSVCRPRQPTDPRQSAASRPATTAVSSRPTAAALPQPESAQLLAAATLDDSRCNLADGQRSASAGAAAAARSRSCRPTRSSSCRTGRSDPCAQSLSAR